MLDWMNPLAFLQTIIRVAITWVAFYGAGYLVERFTGVRKLFPLLPREISGILLLISLEVPLSILGVMNRTVTPVLLLIFSVPGLFLLLQKAKNINRPDKFSILKTIGILALLAVITMNLAYASMPNLDFDDPLITYAVQPDRWLNTGKVYWLEETAFSGFPLTYEMMAVWPASLSSDRMDQLSILQVFQMTLLFFAIFRGMQIIGIKRKYWIPLTITTLLCAMLFYWSSLAKTDTAAILFSTLALASAIKELNDKSLNQYSSWLFMGLALATKQTALLVLVPFVLYKIHRFFTSSKKVKAISLICISLVPLIFAVRTMIHTGSPTYPEYQIPFLVKDEWKLLPLPEELITLTDRASEFYENTHYSTGKHIGIFLTSMEGIFLLFLGGLGIVLTGKDRRWLLFLPILVYFAVSIIVLWPPWWGAKYAILIYPFVALLGVKAIQSREKFCSVYLSSICILSFVVPGFIIAPKLSLPAAYRYTVVKSVLTGTWDSTYGYTVFLSTPEGMTYMWMNSALSDESTILSLHEEKRYFYDSKIYVGWRHPATQALYLNNSLEDECAILDQTGIDYVTFYRADPSAFEMEKLLMILDHVGRNDILEPVVSVAGNFLVCKYNSPNN